MARIIVCGGNGAGKSTLGKALARELGYTFMDIEDYYFAEKNREYDYAAARSREEVAEMLLKDMRSCDAFVLASVKGNYGAEVSGLFDCAVFVSVPKAIRQQRVWERSYKKFGERMLPGGDLYEKEEKFFAMVESRSESDVVQWLDTLDIPIIKVDGTQPIERSINEIKQRMAELR